MEHPLTIPSFSNVAVAPAHQPAPQVDRSKDFLHVVESPAPQVRSSVTTGVYIATIVIIALVGWFGQLTFRGMAIANAVEADKITIETRDIRRDTLQIQADVAQRLAPAQLEATAKEMGMTYGPVPTFVTVETDQYVPAAPPGATVLTPAQDMPAGALSPSRVNSQ
ncbi:hypothetical protein [Stomatohabitans albus]|uniref:hypothetical protein n=1 Tax=Stomatohabitans albus TaxID=3110766 RepID=UPI00300C6D39